MRPAGSFGPTGTSFCAIAEAATSAGAGERLRGRAASLRAPRWTSAARPARAFARFSAGLLRAICLAIPCLRLSCESLAVRTFGGNPRSPPGRLALRWQLRSSRRAGSAQLVERAQHAHPFDVLLDIAVAQMRVRAAEHALVIARHRSQRMGRAPNRTIGNHACSFSPLRTTSVAHRAKGRRAPL